MIIDQLARFELYGRLASTCAAEAPALVYIPIVGACSVIETLVSIVFREYIPAGSAEPAGRRQKTERPSQFRRSRRHSADTHRYRLK